MYYSQQNPFLAASFSPSASSSRNVNFNVDWRGRQHSFHLNPNDTNIGRYLAGVTILLCRTISCKITAEVMYNIFLICILRSTEGDVVA